MRRLRSLQQSLAATLGGIRVRHLLDAACGDGTATVRLLRAGMYIEELTAVDREAPESFDRFAEIPRYRFVHSDLVRWLDMAGDATPPAVEPDACVVASALHHLPYFDRVLVRIAGLEPRFLIVWEPLRCDGCPCAALHELKAEIDREIGLWHRRPYSYDVLLRELNRLRSFGVEWWHFEVVEPRAEELSVAELSWAVERTTEYLRLVQERPVLYSTLARRLRLLSTCREGCRGEPHLLAIGSKRLLAQDMAG